MLGIFAMKNAFLIGSVSDRAKLSTILDQPLNKDALFKDAFAMEPWLSLSKDINGRRILSKLRMGSQISCRNESTYCKRVSIHTSQQFALNVTRIRKK